MDDVVIILLLIYTKW